MRTERPRARRYQFTASIECTAVQSNLQLEERTTDLSSFGCCVSSRQPLPVGTKVRVRISRAGVTFIAMGKVGHVRPNEEMGIVFTHMESKDQALLDKWLAELRDNLGGQ